MVEKFEKKFLGTWWVNTLKTHYFTSKCGAVVELWVTGARVRAQPVLFSFPQLWRKERKITYFRYALRYICVMAGA